MIPRILEFSLRQRLFVLLATVGLLIGGVWAALRLPIDAVPDITNIQVQVNTEVPALAPEEKLEDGPGGVHRWKPFLLHVLPLVLIFGLVVGAMTAGWATPT